MGDPHPYTPTPNSARFAAAVAARFGWARFSRYNCRKIAGSSAWSQHAESNADDVHSSTFGKINITKDQGDELVAWLLDDVTTVDAAGTVETTPRYRAYGIRTILWWEKSVLTGNPVAGHKDHIHVDYWPRMASASTYVPPCQGGTLLVVYPDGSTDSTWAVWPDLEIVEDLDVIYLRDGDTGTPVTILQSALMNYHGAVESPPFDPIVVDGVYGSKTETAVKAWQGRASVPSRFRDVPGVDHGSWALLLDRWYPDRLIPEHGNDRHKPDFATVDHDHGAGADLGDLPERVGLLEVTVDAHGGDIAELRAFEHDVRTP